jgi:hypothetical protein
MMAGAEGERCLDLDADAVCPHPRAIMRAMHHKTSGTDRRQSLQALAHPVGGCQRFEHEGVRCLLTGRGRDQGSQPRLIGSIAEMQGEGPTPVRLLEGRGRDLVGIEALAQRSIDRFRRRGIGREPRDCSWRRLRHCACISLDPRS